MKILRWIIGRVILMFNFIFSPSKPKRTAQQQAKLDQSTEHMSLYQLNACPFCVKVRRAMKRQGLNIELRDIHQGNYLEELIANGGKRTVPCLRIDSADGNTTWMYESSDIVAYLDKHVQSQLSE